MNQYETRVLSFLPPTLAEAAVRKAGLCGGGMDEIRLRLGRPLVITVNGENMGCGTVCTEEHLTVTVRNLCGNSLYSHADTIREGYIDAGNGIRAGVCGQAVVENGRVTVVRDITSLAIRIPRRVRGAADAVYGAMEKKGFHTNVLVYAKPGMGKTTVLRELAVRLSSGAHPRRVAVVDTRSEISMGLEDGCMLDLLRGYPRNVGIETAVRTLSPQYILCDELLTAADADAVISAHGSGVHFCASVHADSFESLMKQPLTERLRSYSVFDTYVGLLPTWEEGKRYRMEITS